MRSSGWQEVASILNAEKLMLLTNVAGLQDKQREY